jgi:hypothetical protein
MAEMRAQFRSRIKPIPTVMPNAAVPAQINIRDTITAGTSAWFGGPLPRAETRASPTPKTIAVKRETPLMKKETMADAKTEALGLEVEFTAWMYITFREI